jgi:hypothetical protein
VTPTPTLLLDESSVIGSNAVEANFAELIELSAIFAVVTALLAIFPELIVPSAGTTEFSSTPLNMT